MDPIPTILVSSTSMPRCSRRVVIQPNRFMNFGESFEAIIEECEIYSIDYDETMSILDIAIECQDSILKRLS